MFFIMIVTYITYFLIISILLFFLGLLGLIFNRKNILIILMSIELVLLAVNLNFVIFSVYLDDIFGQIFSLFILTVAAAESAIGLALLVTFYRVKSSITIEEVVSIKNAF